MILSQFQNVGNALFTRGLVASNNGNLSIRLGDRIIITRRGCSLGSLEEHDLIETGLEKNDQFTPLTSIELPVHRAIYRETPAQAIVHAHPPHTIALSLTETKIIPTCIEEEEPSPLNPVLVLGWHMKVKPVGLAEMIASALKGRHIIVVRGHGTYAIGQLLEEAHNYTTAFEESCQVQCLLKSLQVKPQVIE